MTQRFIDETEENIQERMLDRMDDDIDKRQGSVAFDLTAPATSEIAQAYQALNDVLTYGFASEDMPSEFLDLRTAELGVYRKPSVKAVGKLTFTGEDETHIDVGSRARTDEDNPINFVTTEEGTITDGTLTLKAEADIGGLSGNVGSGSITIMLDNLSGVVNVNNDESFDGGADTESDESLLQRYFDRTQKPVTSGNIYHYEQWAKEVPGVGDVKVYPIWDGPGTVKVVLLDDEKKPPAQSVIDAAIKHIEGNRPIGAEVTVVGADKVTVDISATLVLADGAKLAEVKSEIERGVSKYLANLAFSDPTVRYTRIASVLISISSILDYTELLVNGGMENFDVKDAEVALLGEVTADVDVS